MARRVWRSLRRRALPYVLIVWRHLMVRTTVIAITGSVGKTTAKEALAAVLATQGRVLKTRNNENDEFGVPRTLLALRPWHRYAVIEVATSGPGSIAALARLVRPDVAVVLSVAGTHTDRLRSLDDTAREKASLLAALGRRGIAVQNTDDPRVRAMTPPAGVRQVWFGTAESADVRATGASGAWPRRLSVDVDRAGTRLRVESQLVGEHWAPSLLAALAVADVLDVPLQTAADAIATVVPFNARLQPVRLPGGAVVIRDENTAAPDSVEAMLTVMRSATAERRVLVFSDYSDVRQSPRRRLRRLGALAAETAELAVFVGGHAHHAVHGALAAGMDPASCHDLVNLEDAAVLLRRELRRGDVVFLKGRATDHLSRLLFAQFGEIGCWTTACTFRRPCEFCPRLQPAFDVHAVLAGARVPPPAAGTAG